MADSDKKKADSKKLGDFLVVSKGAINHAVEQQISSYTKSGKLKPIGEILVEQGIISKDELENSIRKQRVGRLSSCPVFSSLSNTELTALSKHFTEVSISPGEQFIMQGEEDPSMYVIAYGLVEIFKINNEGKEIHIAEVGEGEPIGEMGYFSGGKRTACARAIEPTQLLKTEYDRLTEFFINAPWIAIAFAKVVERRRKELEEIILESE